MCVCGGGGGGSGGQGKAKTNTWPVSLSETKVPLSERCGAQAAVRVLLGADRDFFSLSLSLLPFLRSVSF